MAFSQTCLNHQSTTFSAQLLSGVAQWYFVAFLALLLWIFDQFGSKLNGIFPNLPESPKHNILGPV